MHVRVVVVDDDPTFRELVRALISNGGTQVVGQASNGAEAVTAVERLRPDVVLMDVEIPVRDGIDAAHEIVERWPETEVVMVTGSDSKQMLARLRAEGHSEVVRKDVSDLQSTLARRLGASARRSDRGS